MVAKVLRVKAKAPRLRLPVSLAGSSRCGHFSRQLAKEPGFSNSVSLAESGTIRAPRRSQATATAARHRTGLTTICLKAEVDVAAG